MSDSTYTLHSRRLPHSTLASSPTVAGVSQVPRNVRHLWLMAAMVLTMLFALAEMAAVHALPVARLRRVEPVVEVRGAKASAWSIIRERDAVAFGDTIRTGDKGKADILFSNGTKIAMKSRSSIQIIAPAQQNSPLVIRVFGALSEVFVRPKGNTQVRTAAAIAAARGTEFIVRLPEENVTEVVVSEGSVDFSNEKGQVVVDVNQRSTARVGEAPLPPVAVDVSGELAWTADVTGLPILWKTPFISFDPSVIQTALKTRQATAQANSSDAQAQLRLGEALHDAGEYAEAVTVFTKATELAPQNSAAWLGLSRAQRGRGDGEAALAAAQRAAQLTPGEEATLEIALSQLVRNDTNAAQSAVSGLNSPRAQAVRGIVAMRSNQMDEAITAWNAAFDSGSLTPTEAASLRSLLALALLQRNDIPAALKNAQQAVAEEPRFVDAQSALATVLFFSNRRAEAEVVARKALALDNESPLALLTQGRLLLARGDVAGARDALGYVAALAPQLPVVSEQLGDVYLRLRQWHKAEQYYRKALQQNPDSAGANAGLGLVLQETGQTNEALVALQKARELDPNGSLSRSRLALFYIEQGKLKEAAAELPTDLDSTPENATLLVRLSELSLINQDLFSAQEYARRAVRLLPDSALAHFQLGRVYLEQGRSAQAEQEFLQASILDRDFAAARYALGVTRELSATGRDTTRPGSALNSASLAGSNAAYDVQNVGGVGAQDRIQAVLENPTVARVATRVLGDTQIDGGIGTKGQADLSVSHLNESDDRQKLLGLTATTFKRDGGLPNSDTKVERAGASYGWKNEDETFGLFASVQGNRIKQGLNLGVSSLADGRGDLDSSEAVFGGNLRSNSRQRTRFLIRGSRFDENSAFGPYGNIDTNKRTHQIELRHDLVLGQSSRLSVGAYTGTLNYDTTSVIATPVEETLFLNGRTRQSGVYVRDEYSISPKLTLTGQLEWKSIDNRNSFVLESLSTPFASATEYKKDSVEPKLVLDYRVGPDAGIRLRAERTSYSISRLELLSPADLFSSPLADLPRITPSGESRNLDIEYYRTFADSSFLRISMLSRHMKNGLEPSYDGAGGAPFDKAKIRGARVSYEGVLNEETTYFTNLNLLKTHNENTGGDIGLIPEIQLEVGLHWLNRCGWFVQPGFAYQSSRIVPDLGGITRSRRGGFGLTNLRVGRKFGLESTLYVEVTNAFDKQYDVLQVVQPGRSIRAGFSRRF